MPVLAVGTANPGKVAAVKRAIASYPFLASCEIQPLKVSSGVSDQPATLEETTQGATNRAKAAYEQASGSDEVRFGIGMESGLFTSAGKLFDTCACVIWDGEETHIGYSCAWELPGPVKRKFEEEGKNLTDAFNEVGLCSDPDIGDKGGVLAVMTGNRITRPDYTVQSIQMAIVAMEPSVYKCSKNVPPGINAPPDESVAKRAKTSAF